MCKKSICVANFRLLNSQFSQRNQQFYFVNCQTLSIWKCHFAYRPQAQHSQFLRVEVTSFVANKLNYLISCGPPQAIVASNSAKPHDTSLRCELQKLLLYIHYSSSPHTTPNIHIHNKCSVTSSISHTISAIQTRTDDPWRPKMTSYRNITSTNICAKVILTWRLQIVCSTRLMLDMQNCDGGWSRPILGQSICQIKKRIYMRRLPNRSIFFHHRHGFTLRSPVKTFLSVQLN